METCVFSSTLHPNQWRMMSTGEREAFLHRALDGVRSALTRKFGDELRRIKPDWLDGLYVNCLFPNFRDGTTTYRMDPNDLFSGEVHYDSMDGRKYALRWTGYVSRHYDGQLFLSAVCPGAHIVCDVENEPGCRSPYFRFYRDVPETGVWPGFLVLSSKPSAPEHLSTQIGGKQPPTCVQ